MRRPEKIEFHIAPWFGWQMTTKDFGRKRIYGVLRPPPEHLSPEELVAFIRGACPEIETILRKTADQVYADDAESERLVKMVTEEEGGFERMLEEFKVSEASRI